MFLLIFAVIAAVPWCLRLPLPTTTDESHYLKYLLHDRDRFVHGGVHKLVTGMIFDEWTRPPGYRIGVAPFIAVFGVNFAWLRLVSLGWLVVSAAIVAMTVRGFTRSWPAAAVAAVAAVVSSKVYLSTIHFGTEYCLYLGTALTFFGLLRDWDSPRFRLSTWWLLTAGLAISALAKASFFVLTLGPVALVAGLWWMGRIRGPGVRFLAVSVVVAAILVAPWWIHNHKPAMAFALYSVAFRGEEMGRVQYLLELFRHEIGLPVALLMAACIGTFAFKWRPHRTRQAHLALLVLLFPVAVLIGLQMVTSNKDGRLVSHAFFPLAIATGLALADLGWLRTTGGVVVVIAMLAWQTAVVAGPPRYVSAFNTRLPWLSASREPPLHDWPTIDWEPLRAACVARGTPLPTIAVMGYTNDFNSDQLQIPWALHGQDLKTVDQLWRPDMGDLNRSSLLARAVTRDVIVTVPELSIGEHRRDNEFNAAFAALVAADPAFGPPTVITVGTGRAMAVDVFFRKPPAPGAGN